MANKRLPAATLQADLDSFAALKAIPTYEPMNSIYNIDSITEIKEQMDTSQTLEIQTTAAADSARDNAIAKEWEFHHRMLGSKDQVKAQYGVNSNELQAIGLKKKSDYRTGRRKPSKP